jgi:MFS family permease
VWLGVVGLCLIQFVDVLGVTVVVTALPAMLTDLGAPESAGALIATGYATFFGGLLMFGARLGDRYGHRRIIIVGLNLFAVAAVLGASAGSVVVLTAARCLQGAAAAVSVPCALRLLTTITGPGAQRRKAVAMWSAAGAAAGASGFVIGGVITKLAGWRVVFWAYVPLAVMLLAVVCAAVHDDPDQSRRERAVSLALPSVVAFTAAVMLFVLSTTLLPQRGLAVLGAVLLGAAVVAAAMFVLIDQRAAAPLLPRPLLTQWPLRQGAVGSFLNTATTSSAITLTTLYLQDSRGRDPLQAGLLLLPFSVAVIGGSALAAPALARWPAQLVIAVGLTAIAGFDAALIVAAGSGWALPMCVAVGGAGIGLSSVAATGLATTVPTSMRGTASGVVNTAAQLGTAVGIAGLLLVAGVTGQAPAPGTPPPALAWALAATTSLAGAISYASRNRRQPTKHTEQDRQLSMKMASKKRPPAERSRTSR